MSCLDKTEKFKNITDEITIKNLEKELKNQIEERDEKFCTIFKKIKEKAKDFASIDYFIDECYDEPGYEFVNDIEYIEPIGQPEEHRWYIIGDNLYKINIDNKNYYFGATEVTSLKSESMGCEDTFWETKVFNVKKIIKEVYVPLE